MATLVQTQIVDALSELKFEKLSSDMPGAPAKFKVNDETLEFLRGKSFSIHSEGHVEFDEE